MWVGASPEKRHCAVSVSKTIFILRLIVLIQSRKCSDMTGKLLQQLEKN